MENIEILSTIAQNSPTDFLVALLMALIVFGLLALAKQITEGHLFRLAQKTTTEIDDKAVEIAQQVGWPLYIFVALYTGARFLILPEIITSIISSAALVAGTWYGIKILLKTIQYAFRKAIQRKKEENKDFNPTPLNILQKLITGAVWVLALVLIIQNFGYDVSALIAGLGVGGVAIAFALQNVLGDIFAYFSIQFDRPFQVGDFIIIGNDSGTVKKVGIKSTRVKTVQGEELIISNTELTTARVRNFKRMRKRQVVFNIFVMQDTPEAKLSKIQEIAEKACTSVEEAKFKRAHIIAIKTNGIEIEISYELDSSNFDLYLDAHHQVSLAMQKELQKARIQLSEGGTMVVMPPIA